jgi:hypothetical protein
VPANESIDLSMPLPSLLGMATAINFQMAGDKAAIAGDFVLLSNEVNPVLKSLSASGITVTAVHNHMLNESPRLFMMHFWAKGDPAELAIGIKAALDLINIKRGCLFLFNSKILRHCYCPAPPLMAQP